MRWVHYLASTLRIPGQHRAGTADVLHEEANDAGKVNLIAIALTLTAMSGIEGAA